MSVRIQDYIFEVLRETGGDGDMSNFDGSSTPVIFEYVVPAGIEIVIKRSITLVCSTAGPDPRMDLFGNMPALTNGLEITFRDDADTAFFTGVPKNNGDMSLFAGAGVIREKFGSNSAVRTDWKVNEELDNDGLLMLPGYKFRVTVQDDLTGFDMIFWTIKAYVVG